MSAPVADVIVPVDKPIGPTSHDVVAAARRALGVRRIGHTGTLDPFASGLLLLCVGQATRIAEYLSGLDKAYEAVARLGESTDTEDLRGKVVEVRGGWDCLDRDTLTQALACFRGAIDQVPPQFSAKKVDGEAMHRRARRGEHVELEPRRVMIYELEVTAFSPPTIGFRVRCSSGTYVRSLARDIGEALGFGAHLTSLRRTRVGRFDVAGAVQLDGLSDREAVAAASIQPAEALAHLSTYDVDAQGLVELGYGRTIPFEGVEPTGPVAIRHSGGLVAVGEVSDGRLRPKKVLAT